MQHASSHEGPPRFRGIRTAAAFAFAAAIAAGAVAVTLSPSLRAEEGGSGHYMPGAAASFIDGLPGRPGLAVANYFTFYSGSASGDRGLPIAGIIEAEVDATVYADILLGIYQTHLQLLGGNYAFGAAVPLVSLEVEGRVSLGPLGRSARDTDTNVGDITLYPFMLGWTALNGDLKYDVRLGIYAPTGDFDVGSLANTGKNYWTFEPGIFVSYLSSTIGLEASTYVGFDFNTKNEATDYHSGDAFHVDATIAQHLPLLGGIIGVGATGFYYRQISPDTGSGARLGDFEGHTVGVGPVLSYVTKVGGRDVVAEMKWLPELDVKNRLEGDFIWFKLGVLF